MGGPMGGAVQSEGFPLDEPPLMEELGIVPEEIIGRIKSVLLFRDINSSLVEGTDLGGPILIILALGVTLMCAGKLHFSYIYGIGMIGSLGTNVLVNLMSPKADGLDLYRTMSILGYCLLPICVLSTIGVFVSLRGPFGLVLSMIIVPWCTLSASKFFDSGVAMHHCAVLVGCSGGSDLRTTSASKSSQGC